VADDPALAVTADGERPIVKSPVDPLLEVTVTLTGVDVDAAKFVSPP
jgi:hypothetical protein